MQTPQWLSRSQDIHQARSRNKPPPLCAEAERYARKITRLSFRAVDPYVTPVDREALLDIPNVYNYQAFVETDKAGFLIRQWIASNLYDRIRRVLFVSHTPHIHLHPARVHSCPPSKRNGSCSSCLARFRLLTHRIRLTATSSRLTSSSHPQTGYTSLTLHRTSQPAYR